MYKELNRKGARVKDQLAEVFASHDLPVKVYAAGSLFAIHFTDQPVVDYRSKATSNAQLTREFFLRLVNNGILMAPRAMGSLSTPTVEDDFERFNAAVELVTKRLAPRWQ